MEPRRSYTAVSRHVTARLLIRRRPARTNSTAFVSTMSVPSCSLTPQRGEGVSLHHWCHRAVYLDRTFNAGHFLQSQDRIHRLGLSENTDTQFIILSSGSSIDEVVGARIQEKVAALAQLLDDPGLVRISLPSDETDDGRESADDGAVDQLDAAMVLRHLDGLPS